MHNRRWFSSTAIPAYAITRMGLKNVFADTFLHFKAGDIGYAKICWGDYAWAKGYHTNIVLTRDKTLMEGHSCCNHRYTWIG